jgi:hypothetical protein
MIVGSKQAVPDGVVVRSTPMTMVSNPFSHIVLERPGLHSLFQKKPYYARIFYADLHSTLASVELEIVSQEA